MKKYKYPILIFLFKYLSKFALLFKPKNTLMYKSTIVKSINAYINSYFHTDYGQFNIENGILIISTMDLYKIHYVVTDPNGFKFDIYLGYYNGVVQKTISISSSEDITYANSFFNHFLADSFNFSSLFFQLNTAV